MRSRASLKSHPIHPMLVSFPIGLWVTGFLFDLLGSAQDSPGLWAAGYYCLVAGCVGAVLAAIPGAIDLFSTIPPDSSAKKRGYLHGGLNVVALAVFAYLASRRGSAGHEPDSAELLIAAAALALIGFTGWLGGTLVYRNQIGVDHRYANAGVLRERRLRSWDQPACNVSELSDGQMMLVIRDQERVAIGRCGEGIAAFSDHCTHRGGPLSDGALVGCVVQCPWHGSQFDIFSGRVVAGPAQSKIKTYQVDIRNGEVFVLEKEAGSGAAPDANRSPATSDRIAGETQLERDARDLQERRDREVATDAKGDDPAA